MIQGDPLLEEKLKDIRAVITDVDGVLTDGLIHMSPLGEGKSFCVLDGMAFKMAERVGIVTGILSGRASKALSLRMDELGIAVAKMGRLDKQTALQEISAEMNLPMSAMAYIGDDLPDLAPLQMAGCGFCPLNAVQEVKALAHVVPVPGGQGVFRWVMEHILVAQGKWPSIIKSFEVKHD